MKKIFIKKIFLQILFVALLVCVSHNFVFAQDDTDLFKGLEDSNNTIKEEGKSNKSGLIQNIADNLDGNIKLRYQYFPKMAKDRDGLDDNPHFAEGSFEFSTWTGNDTVQLQTSCLIQDGTQKNSYQGYVKWFQDEKDYRRYFECNELYFLFLTDLIDVTLGKKLFNTGISTLYSPSDRFRPSDYHDPTDPLQLGIWQGKIDFTIGIGAFTLMVIPIHTDNKFPAIGSRWWGEQSIDDSMNVENENQDIKPENVDVFGKFETTKGNLDFFFSMNTGPNPYDVVKQVGMSSFVITKNRIYSFACGFSTTAGIFEYHGESLYNYSEGRKDDDYISSVIGVTCTLDDWAKYLLMEQIIVTVEYCGEKKLRSQDADGYVLSSHEERIGRKELLSKINFKYNQDLTCILNVNINFETESWMNSYEFKYKIMDNLTWSLAYQIFSSYGSEDKKPEVLKYNSIYYSDWVSNDRLVTYIKYSF